LGFSSKTDDAKTVEQQYEKMKEKVLNELKNTFRPEFLNRIDSTVVFHALSKEDIRKIVELMLSDVDKQLSFKGMSLEVKDAAKDWLGERGYDQVFGARPLRRVIQNEVEDRLSEAVLDGRFQAGDTIVIDCEEDAIVLREVPQPARLEPRFVHCRHVLSGCRAFVWSAVRTSAPSAPSKLAQVFQTELRPVAQATASGRGRPPGRAVGPCSAESSVLTTPGRRLAPWRAC
jgi:hypothetical protein